MGKKHKKHKAEKPEDVRSAEYVEKPLKLVLKVGSGEVKEISTARATALPQSFHEDKSDHDKHKDKKKKKKKKEEKKVGPGEEKKKKKDEKKKKDRNQHESEAEKERKIQSPMRVDMPAVPVPESSLAKPEENQTPLQEALNQLVRQLQRKDPSAFFSFPVTDFIAPGYSMVIKNPMDFSTVKEKIKTNEYQSIEELKEDFTQICDNAMVYNKPGTVYYKAATKLLNSGIKILSQERIQSLKQSIDFMVDLQTDGKERGPGEAQGADGQVKEESMDTDDVTAFKSPIKELKRRERDLQEDRQRLNESAAEKEKEQIDLIIKGSLGKLSKRGISSQLEFERRKPDGTTTLGLLNPPADAHPGEMGYSHTHLGLAASRLQAGVNSLHGFKEDKRNKVTPVLYLNYGPFSSYAPAYDSTFANISKDDSDLIYTTYGDEPSAQGAFSIQEFLESTQDPPYGMADCILDAVTNGEYSRSQRVLDMAAESGCTSKLDYNSTADQLACLKSVFGLGIFEETFDSAEAGAFQRKLDETTSLLRELQDVQSKRLSTKPPPNAVCLLAPSAQELQLSEKVNGNLKELAQQVNPGDIVSVQGVRKAMGISAPPPGSDQALVDLTADTQEKGAIPGSGECVVVGT